MGGGRSLGVGVGVVGVGGIEGPGSKDWACGSWIRTLTLVHFCHHLN